VNARNVSGLADRIHLIAVADSITSAIDRVFDLVDSGAEKLDRVLSRTKRVEDQHRARHARRVEIIDTAPSVKTGGTGVRAESADPSVRPAATALAVRKWRIVEAIAAESGTPIFVVTNGREKAECATRELAEKLVRMLEMAP
jgi:hypothetical protein